MVHNKKETARAYNVVAKIICTILPISCSQKSNAKWSIQDFFYGITAMCTANTYSESAMKGLTIQSDGPNPCGRWIRNAIQSITEQQMLLGLSDGIDSTVSHLKKLGMFRKPVTVAIDKHFIPRYDKIDSPYLIKSKSKNSTTIFEGYGSIQCVEKQCRAQIGCTPIKKGQTKADIVRKLLDDINRNEIKIRLTLLDREFFSAAVIHEIKQNHDVFIMPARKTPGIKKAILQYVNGNREAISEYRIHSSSGHVESFTLVIMPSLNPRASNVIDRYIVFATNVSPKEVSQNIAEIPSQYKKRWGIETGYAYVGRFRPKTTTTNQSIRLLYFYYSLILYNAWIVANILYLQESSGIYHKPIISIELLRHFFSRIIVEWFCNHTKNYHLECVK